MRLLLSLAATLSGLLALVGLTLWACPALGAELGATATGAAPIVAWGAGGVSVASLLGLGVWGGRVKQQLGDQDRRIGAVEACTPKLAALEAAREGDGKLAESRHQELLGRLDRIDERLDRGRP